MEAHVCQPMHAQNHTDINKSRHKYMPHLSNHAGGVNIYLYGWVSLLAPLCCVCVCVFFWVFVFVCVISNESTSISASQRNKAAKRAVGEGVGGNEERGRGLAKLEKRG